MRRAVLAASLLLLLVPSAALAQEAPVVARSEVDRTTMAIGDQVLFTITVELVRGYDLNDPGVPRAIGDFEVVDTLSVLQARLADGRARIQLRYLLTTFELGPKQIPTIIVGYRAPSGDRGQAATQGGFVIAVESVIAPGEDASDIKPLKPPLPLPGAENVLVTRVLPASVAVVALFAVAAVLWLRLRGRVATPLVPEEVPRASRQALAELERVVEMRLPEQGRTREHYDLVAAAVRAFVAQRYGIAASSRTAREVRRELERAGVVRSQAQLLCEVLADAESVRYEERVIYPARAQKTMRDLTELMRRSLVAEEYELVSTGTSA